MKNTFMVIISLSIGIPMHTKATAQPILESFDDILGSSDPVTAEAKFKELLPEAESRSDKSIYLQILSQIALVQAMQKKFEEAHKTLDKAQISMTPTYQLAKARLLLERGRVFHQTYLFGPQDKDQRERNITKAISHFKESYDLSKANRIDYHTANAAHMLGIASKSVQEKIQWNELAIEHASKSTDQRTKTWIGALYNNLGQNYLEAKAYEKALPVFQKALKIKEQEGVKFFVRMGKWTVAHTLRLLNRLDESLEILNQLIRENEDMVKNKTLDVPEQVLSGSRGLLYEDLAEIYAVKAKLAAGVAYDDLSKEEWIHLDEYKHRLDRLIELKR